MSTDPGTSTRFIMLATCSSVHGANGANAGREQFVPGVQSYLPSNAQINKTRNISGTQAGVRPIMEPDSLLTPGFKPLQLQATITRRSDAELINTVTAVPVAPGGTGTGSYNVKNGSGDKRS